MNGVAVALATRHLVRAASPVGEGCTSPVIILLSMKHLLSVDSYNGWLVPKYQCLLVLNSHLVLYVQISSRLCTYQLPVLINSIVKYVPAVRPPNTRKSYSVPLIGAWCQACTWYLIDYHNVHIQLHGCVSLAVGTLLSSAWLWSPPYCLAVHHSIFHPPGISSLYLWVKPILGKPHTL